MKKPFKAAVAKLDASREAIRKGEPAAGSYLDALAELLSAVTRRTHVTPPKRKKKPRDDTWQPLWPKKKRKPPRPEQSATVRKR